jgi:hypothetical protein
MMMGELNIIAVQKDIVALKEAFNTIRDGKALEEDKPEREINAAEFKGGYSDIKEEFIRLYINPLKNQVDSFGAEYLGLCDEVDQIKLSISALHKSLEKKLDDVCDDVMPRLVEKKNAQENNHVPTDALLDFVKGINNKVDKKLKRFEGKLADAPVTSAEDREIRAHLARMEVTAQNELTWIQNINQKVVDLEHQLQDSCRTSSSVRAIMPPFEPKGAELGMSKKDQEWKVKMLVQHNVLQSTVNKLMQRIDFLEKSSTRFQGSIYNNQTKAADDRVKIPETTIDSPKQHTEKSHNPTPPREHDEQPLPLWTRFRANPGELELVTIAVQSSASPDEPKPVAIAVQSSASPDEQKPAIAPVQSPASVSQTESDHYGNFGLSECSGSFDCPKSIKDTSIGKTSNGLDPNAPVFAISTDMRAKARQEDVQEDNESSSSSSSTSTSWYPTENWNSFQEHMVLQTKRFADSY